MTRSEDAMMLGAQPNAAPVKPPITQPPIATWLSELEQKIAADFKRRTDLDYKTTVAQIVAAADPFPGMHVLDVPTGTGVIARQFVGKVGEKGRIIGIDETDEQINQARLAAQSAKLSLRIEWKKMPIEKLNFADGAFDLVTSGMAFHRLNAAVFLAESYRVLRAGGRLLIADELAPAKEPTALKQSARRAYFKFIARNQSEAEARFYNTEELMDLLTRAGFTQIVFHALRQRSARDRVFTLVKAVK